MTGTAGDVLAAYLAEQVGVIVGGGESVHRTRVATRRLRSTLRVFARMFAADGIAPIRAEAGWFAGVLGLARDAEVRQERILGSVRGLSDEDVVGPVRRRITDALEARSAEARAGLAEARDSERYAALERSLQSLVDEPPLLAEADASGTRALARLIHREIDRVEGETDLHEARKRSKAVRYGYEALAPAAGDAAREAAAVWEAATEALGELQDSIVARQWLRAAARTAEAAGESTFTYGVLVGGEAARERRARRAGRKALRRALNHAAH